ncbi:MAG: AAA family ATPase [Candidatus Sericytochromatia bacterium]|nr:AAA family ATPase [Candidatus Sericytochromatia bacterium]
MTEGVERRHRVAAYLPHWVAGALSRSERPYTREQPTALLWLDIVGFTALTERLAAESRSGAEHLTDRLNVDFGRISRMITSFGGDLASFAGDAVLALWRCPDEAGLPSAIASAEACARALFEQPTGEDSSSPLPIKAVLGAGPLVYSLLGGHRGRWLPLLQGTALAALAASAEGLGPGQLALTPEAEALRAEGKAIRPDAAAPPPAAAAVLEAGLALLPERVQAHLGSEQDGWLGELRQVTILFVRLPGLETGQRAQSVIRGLQESIDRHDGSLDKLSVDDKGVSALIATGLPPRTRPDAAVTALRLALALQDQLRAAGIRGGIGIATGRAYCGEVGSSTRVEYTVMGDVVNLAARLMTKAGESILMDEATAKPVGVQMVLRPGAPLTLKGKAVPVNVYEPHHWRRRPRFRLADLLGREDLMASLMARLAPGASAGARGPICVLGEPGLGKSTLLEGVAEALGPEFKEFIHLAGRTARSGSPLQPWREPLARLWDTRAPRLSRQDQALLAGILHPDHGASDDLDPNDDEGWIRAVGAATLRLLATGPTLLLIDDAHLLDSASGQLVRELLRRRKDLVLLATSLPRTDWFEVMFTGSIPDIVQVDPLDPNASRLLLLRRFGNVAPPARVLERILTLAGGHPLFLEELADTVLASPGGTDGQPGELDLPPTIQAALLRRIDPLPAAEQTLLKILCVVGTEAEPELLMALHGGYPSRSSLDRALGHLVEANLLDADTAGSPGLLTFRNNLVREALQDQLLDAQKTRVHRDAADWLERVHGVQPSPASVRLARHRERSGAYGAALMHLDHAAVWAMTHHATQDAESCCRKALALEGACGLTAEPHLKLARHEILGRILKGKGNLGEAKRHLDIALALAETLQDVESKAHILSSVAMVAELSGDYVSAISHYEMASSMARSVDAGWPYLRSMLYLSRLQFRTGAIEDAAETCRYAVAFESLWGHLSQAMSLRAWALMMVLMTRTDGSAVRHSIASLVAGLGGLRERQDWSTLFNVLGFIGNAHGLVGQHELARSAFAESLLVADTHAGTQNEPAVRLNLALQAHALGENDTMRREATRSRVLAEEGGNKTIHALALRLEALAEAHLGRIEATDRLMAEADAVWAGLPETTRTAFQIPDHTYQAWTAAALGRDEACLTLVEKARAAFQPVGDREYALPLALLHADTLTRLGRPAEARQQALDALEQAEALGHEPGLNHVRQILATLDKPLIES